MYSPEERKVIYGHVCREIANGRSLRRICDQDEIIEGGIKLPTIETIRVWLLEEQEFSAQYMRARLEQADYFADEVVDIADEAVAVPAGMEGKDETTIDIARRSEMERRRQRIDARKWRAAQLKPKVYGNRTIMQGDDEAPPIRMQSDLGESDKRDLARWMAAVLIQAGLADSGAELGGMLEDDGAEA